MWREQTLFLLDLDNDPQKPLQVNEVIELCAQGGIKPSFIYETFNSSPGLLKMRVAFVANRPITNRSERQQVIEYLASIFPVGTIDHRCLNPGRIFYGSNKRLLSEDAQATFDVEMVLKRSSGKAGRHVEKRKNEKEGGTLSFFHKSEPPNPNSLKTLEEITPQIVDSYSAMIAYLTQEVNLHDYLGVTGKKFNCPFHPDDKPSAGIFWSKSGEWYFKCHGCGCRGNIIALTEIMQGCGRIEAIRYLQNLYQITIHESDPYLLLQENMRMLYTSEIRETYPILYKAIRRYLPELRAIHQIALNVIPCGGTSERVIFFASNHFLGNLTGKAKSYISVRIALLTFLKLCRKLDDSEVPREMLSKAITFRVKHSLNESVQFYELPSFSVTTLLEASRMAELYKANGGTIKGMSREWILRTLGEAEANRVYPKQNGKSLPPGSEEFQKKVDVTVTRLLRRRDYITEGDILPRLNGIKEYDKVCLKRCLQETATKHGLIRKRATKSLKKEYKVKAKGYPIVYIRPHDTMKVHL